MIKNGGGVSRASTIMEYARCQLITLKLCGGQNHTKIHEDINVSRSLVFKVQKLSDHGENLKPQPWAERSYECRQMPPSLQFKQPSLKIWGKA
jgi:hypothetical protein